MLTDGKPTQRGRFGEFSEGLPGSTKSAGCVERSIEDLGGPGSSWAGEWGVPPPAAGRPTESKSRGAEDARESDQSIVLGDGRTVHKGKGLTGSRSPQREHQTGQGGPGGVSTSLRGIAVEDAEARLSEEPGARKPHAGICAGGRGVTPFPTATAAL